MSGTTTALAGRRGLATLFATMLAAMLGVLLLVPPPASAATTVKAQLSLSGIATGGNPTGGSQLGVHPGDTVVFSASTLPTAGLDTLGLGDLVGGLLNTLATYQVAVNFSGLPSGNNNTVLTGKKTATFTFPKEGTYNFTWSAQSIGLLGVVPITLDGNQLEQAGIKLNAKNQYVGQIVVAKNPPKGGISIQLPGISLQPELPILGKLPKISLPGVTTPTIPITVPDLNPTKKSTGKSTSKSTGTSTAPLDTSVLPVPAMVVPHGNGKIFGNPGNFQGTVLNGNSSPVGTSGVAVAPVPGAAPVSTAAPATPATSTVRANSAGKDKTIDLASNSPSSSGLPAVLALIAVLALALVAGAYARLFLLRKNS